MDAGEVKAGDIGVVDTAWNATDKVAITFPRYLYTRFEHGGPVPLVRAYSRVYTGSKVHIQGAPGPNVASRFLASRRMLSPVLRL